MDQGLPCHSWKYNRAGNKPWGKNETASVFPSSQYSDLWVTSLNKDVNDVLKRCYSKPSFDLFDCPTLVKLPERCHRWVCRAGSAGGPKTWPWGWHCCHKAQNCSWDTQFWEGGSSLALFHQMGKFHQRGCSPLYLPPPFPSFSLPFFFFGQKYFLSSLQKKNVFYDHFAVQTSLSGHCAE